MCDFAVRIINVPAYHVGILCENRKDPGQQRTLGRADASFKACQNEVVLDFGR